MLNSRKIIIKPHFLYIINLLYPYLTLLIIPILRGVLRFVFDKSRAFSQFLFLELAVLTLAVIVSVIKFKKYSIEVGGGITVKKGLFCRTEYTVKMGVPKITVIESNPFLRSLGVYRLKIYTEAGHRHRPDESVLIGVGDAKRLYALNAVNGESVRSNTYGEVIMSAALSSSATGILLSIPIVKLSFSLLGKSVPSLIPQFSTEALKTLDFAKLGQYATVLLVVGYLVSFLILFLRNYGFSSARAEGKIILKSGKLPHRTVCLDADSVKAVKFITAPIMLCARKCAVKFSACGYGLKKGEIGLLMPSVKPSIAKGLTKWLLPDFEADFKGIKPPSKALKRCIKPPIALFSVFLAAVLAVFKQFPNIAKPLMPIFSVLGFVISIWLAMRIYGFHKSCVAFSDLKLKIKSIRGLQAVELQASKSELYCFKISQALFDRLCGQCSLTVRLQGKNKDTVKVKYIEVDALKEYLENIYRQME